jgi:ferredoxin
LNFWYHASVNRSKFEEKEQTLMPKLTVGDTTVEVEAGKRLVLAIEEAGVNIGHRCGGKAACTTCRVEFVSGEPVVMTKAEYNKLVERNLFGQYRLSCQLTCDQDMSLNATMTKESEDWTDTGPAPDAEIKPDATFYPIEELKTAD